MHISQTGIDLITKLEGFSAEPYKCSAGVITIGIGTTSINGAPVGWGTKHVSLERAQELLNDYVRKSVEPTLNQYIKVPITQNQYDALCSFIYNIGEPRFIGSTMLKHINAKNFEAAANGFLQWDKEKHKQPNGTTTLVVNKGLQKRRQEEMKLFKMK